MNHFYAITVPAAVQQYISGNIVKWWRPAMGEDFAQQWYTPEDYHLTLKFLGDVPVTEHTRLISAAEPIAAQLNPFILRLAPPGTFPKDNSSARVFWMGVSANEYLTLLVRNLNTAMLGHGFLQDTRTYTPHITLARRRRHDSGRSDSGVVVDEQAFPSWPVSDFSLMRTLSPAERRNGADLRYTIVQTFPFAGQSPAR